MTDTPPPDERADAVRRLGALLDSIDEQARRPDEPSLRTVVADHAREELARLGSPNGEGSTE